MAIHDDDMLGDVPSDPNDAGTPNPGNRESGTTRSDPVDDVMSPSPEGLTKRQEKTIVALLNEPTIPQAAKAAGVGVRSVHRWLADPIFSRAYRTARREAFSHAIALTQRYAPVAVNVLAKIMADPTTPTHARVTAAATLLRFGREGIELDDLAGRIEALETSMLQNGSRIDRALTVA